MRTISDLTTEQAMDLWLENGDDLAAIFGNTKVMDAMKKGNNDCLKVLVSECEEEMRHILLWLDPTPITPFNLFPRVMAFLHDIGSEEQTDFFTCNEKKVVSTALSDVTESTEEKTN